MAAPKKTIQSVENPQDQRRIWTPALREKFVDLVRIHGSYTHALRCMRPPGANPDARTGAEIEGQPVVSFQNLQDERYRHPEWKEAMEAAREEYFMGNLVEDIKVLRPHLQLLANNAIVWEDVPDPENPGDTMRIPVGTKLEAADINALASAAVKLATTTPKGTPIKNEDRMQVVQTAMELSEDETKKLAVVIKQAMVDMGRPTDAN